MSEFSDRLSALISEKGISQRTLAELAETTEATISRYISGQRAPKAITAVKIATALGVNAEYLLYGTDQPFYRDEETLELMEELHRRPELRALFSTSRKASADDIRKVIGIIEDLTRGSDD